MTEEIKCKYKFQNKEKFDGEEFCTLFLEKCKFLDEAGICDCNCQVYEDYKQLQRLKQENRELKEKYSNVLELAKTNADSNEYCLQELEKENETWQKTCEVLKEQAQLDGECIDKLIEARDMYAKALEEIREISKDIIENDVYENSDVKAEKILTKINEVLGNEQI